VAFVMMDLQARAGAALAWRFLNACMGHSGDYGGAAVLYFYLVYRALVRAKISSIRLQQPGLAAEARAKEDASRQAHLALARDYSAPRAAALLVTHGLSGSGKTFLTQGLLENLGAIRVRSDVERKRLHGLGAQERSRSGMAAGLYSPAASRATYDRLARIAAELLEAGQRVIVDAAFLRREQRAKLERVAGERGAPYVVLDVRATEATLRRRMAARLEGSHDASEADAEILDHQIASREGLDAAEQAACIAVDTEAPLGFDVLCERINSRLAPRR